MHPVTPAGVLVGRENELALLHGLLKELTRGCGGVLLIEGEPGIGKSALVRAALAASPQSGSPPGWQAFWGTGDELGQELPLLPFLDALRVREPSANPRRTTIAALLRGEVATDRGADVPAVLAEQLIALTAEECAGHPTVIVIDDLQWADPATVALWGRLARMTHDARLLLIGVMRPVPFRADLLAVRRAAVGDDLLTLAGLGQDAVSALVAELAGGRPGDDLLRLAADAAGNPLYLTELLAALARSAGVTVTVHGSAELTGGPVPQSLPAAIADRLGFVSGPTRRMLSAAALLGVEFAVTDLTTVLGTTVADLVPAVDEARVAGVIAETPSGLAFRHPLIRAALYHAMPTPLRAAWHRDAGRALAAAGGPVDRVARQLLRATGGADTEAASDEGAGPLDGRAELDRPARPPGSTTLRFDSAARPGGAGRPGAGTRPRAGGQAGDAGPVVPLDDWMLDWLAGAADQLIGQAPGVAADLLARALPSVVPSSAVHGWLASRLADALYRTGDRVRAEEVADQALRYAADPDLLVDLHWTLAQCRMVAGAATDSLAILDRALAAPGLSAQHRARLLVLAARTHLYLGSVEDAGHVAADALAAASAGGDTWAEGWALHVLTIATGIRGDMPGALRLFDRALAVTQGDPALTDLGLLLQINKAIALCSLDRSQEAVGVAVAARRLADQVGTAVRLAQAHGALGQVLFTAGRWDEALAELTAVPANLKESTAACCELGMAAVIRFHRGETSDAHLHLAATASHAARLGHRFVGLLALAHSLEREQASDLPAALATLAKAFADGTEELEEIEDLLPDTVRLALVTGDPVTAESLTGQAAKLAADSVIPHQQANALYCRGLLDRDAAALIAAAGRYGDASRPLHRAKALEAAAGEFLRVDDRVQAREAFTHAVDVYTALEAQADVNRLQAEFRLHGIRRGPHSKHRRADSGWDSLTDMELTVAAFVEEGLSNPEIAAKLMLSRRTVGTHVSHILKKLDVTSRTDIARESALRTLAAR